MTGIRGAHAARALVAVERERIGADLLAPEGTLEAFAQRLGLAVQLRRELRHGEGARAARNAALGVIDIGLHLGERDRTAREAAIGMEDAVVGILPALVGEALLGGARIFDEAVAVAVAKAVDPR